MKNNDQVIIDGNAVYEIDMDCKKQSNIGRQSIEVQTSNNNYKDLLLMLLLYFY